MSANQTPSEDPVVKLSAYSRNDLYLPIYVLTAVFGSIFIIGPCFFRKHKHEEIIRWGILLSAACMWAFWVTVYISQMNPLLGPRIANTTLIWIIFKNGTPVLSSPRNDGSGGGGDGEAGAGGGGNDGDTDGEDGDDEALKSQADVGGGGGGDDAFYFRRVAKEAELISKLDSKDRRVRAPNPMSTSIKGSVLMSTSVSKLSDSKNMTTTTIKTIPNLKKV